MTLMGTYTFLKRLNELHDMKSILWIELVTNARIMELDIHGMGTAE